MISPVIANAEAELRSAGYVEADIDEVADLVRSAGSPAAADRVLAGRVRLERAQLILARAGLWTKYCRELARLDRMQPVLEARACPGCAAKAGPAVVLVDEVGTELAAGPAPGLLLEAATFLATTPAGRPVLLVVAGGPAFKASAKMRHVVEAVDPVPSRGCPDPRCWYAPHSGSHAYEDPPRNTGPLEGEAPASAELLAGSPVVIAVDPATAAETGIVSARVDAAGNVLAAEARS